MSAWTTVKCKYLMLRGGELIEKDGRAQPELVYNDAYAAASKLRSGSPVYVDSGICELVRQQIMGGQPELRFK